MKRLPSVVAAGAVAALVLAGCTNQTSAAPGSGGSGASPGSSFVVGAPVRVSQSEYGHSVTGLVADGDSVIVVDAIDQSLVRIDPSGQVASLADGVVGPTHPVLAFGSLWVVLRVAPTDVIARLDPASGEVQAQISIKFMSDQTDLVATGTEVWAFGTTNSLDAGSVWRIDPETNQVTGPLAAVGDHIAAAAYDGTSVWVVGPPRSPTPSDHVRLSRIDATSGAVTRYVGVVPDELLAITAAVVSGGQLWVASQDSENGVLTAFDTHGLATQSLKMGRFASGLLTTPDGLWVSDSVDATVTLIDPATGSAIAGPFSVGTPYPGPEKPISSDALSIPGLMVRAGDTVWVALSSPAAIVPFSPAD
jgi:hypothetical protein